jgi:hypothetical protein
MFQMHRRDVLLITGAIAATCQAASMKSNTTLAIAIGLLGTFLSAIATPPPALSVRDPECRDRAADAEDR